MRVLVTGGAGYIGSHTCKTLKLAGHEPIVFDNLSTGHRWAARFGPLIEADLANSDALRDAFKRFDIEAVLHFAGSAYVAESMRNPREYLRNNVVNSINLLDAMLEAGVKKIIFSSSCTVYGVPGSVPISETHPQIPVNPYGESKVMVERSMKWYAEAYGLDYLALSYFNAAGADPEAELGEVHEPETHLVPLVIQAALGQRPCVEVYGTDYPTPDGTCIRDYIHVSDLAKAHVQALTCLGQGAVVARRINLGTGKGYSVREVIAAVERSSGCKVPARDAPRRPGDAPILTADCRLAEHSLDWCASHSLLDQIVETAWRWHERAPHTCRRA